MTVFLSLCESVKGGLFAILYVCDVLGVFREREQPSRFAQPGSFEYEFGLKWKTLYQMLQEQQDLLKKNFEDEVSKMEMDMEAALMEQHTAMLRQGLFYFSSMSQRCHMCSTSSTSTRTWVSNTSTSTHEVFNYQYKCKCRCSQIQVWYIRIYQQVTSIILLVQAKLDKCIQAHCQWVHNTWTLALPLRNTSDVRVLSVFWHSEGS